MKKFLLSLFISLNGFISIAQTNQSDWYYLLNSNDVRAIQEDSLNMYFGTTGGLIIYNKQTTQSTILRRDNSQIPFHDILCLYVDNQSNIYIGGESQFAKYDGQTWVYYTPQNSYLRAGRLHKIIENNNGEIFVSNLIEGIQKFNGNNFSPNLEVSSYTIIAMGFDQNNKLWYSTPWPLMIYIHNTNVTFNSLDWTNPFILPNGLCMDMEMSPQNKLWMTIADQDEGNYYGAVLYYDNQTLINISDSANLLENVLDISFTSSGKAVLATEKEGILIYHNGHYKVLDTNYLGIGPNKISKVHVDQTGRIWFVTPCGIYFMDANYLNLTKFHHPRNELLSTSVENFMISKDNKKYIFYSGKNSYTLIHNTDTFNISQVSQCKGFYHAEDKNGKMWYQIWRGIAWVKDSTFASFTAPPSVLPYNNYIYNLAADTSGVIYMTTYSGLITFDGTNWNTVSGYPGTSSFFNAIEIDTNNVIYLSSYQDGIVTYSNGIWTILNQGIGKSINVIKASHSGDIWFGTQDGLLYRYNSNNWQIYDSTNSPFGHDSYIYFIEFDLFGNTYFTGYLPGILMLDINNQWSVINRDNSYLNANQLGKIECDVYNNLWLHSNGIALFNPNGVILSNVYNSEPKESFSLRVFPNPTSDIINITTNQDLSNALLTLINTHGEIVYQSRVSFHKNQQINMNLQTYATGIYVLKISYNKTQYIGKLIKQ